MTIPFSPAQKFRILVRFDAQIIVDNTLVHVAQFSYGTMNDYRRFKMLRRDLNCAVRCGCDCGVWAPLHEIDFHHLNEHANGGPTVVKNGSPLRRQPCHARLSAAYAAVTGKVTRCRRKLSVTTGIREDDSPRARTSHRSWPQRSLSDPRWKRTFNGKVERRV